MVCPPHVRLLLDSRLSTRCLSGLPRLGFLLCELSACRSSHCAGRRVVDLWVAACWVAVSGRLVLVAWTSGPHLLGGILLMDTWSWTLTSPLVASPDSHSSPLQTPASWFPASVDSLPPSGRRSSHCAGSPSCGYLGRGLLGLWVAACWVVVFRSVWCLLRVP